MSYNIINKRNRTGSPEKEDKDMSAIKEEELTKVNGEIKFGWPVRWPVGWPNGWDDPTEATNGWDLPDKGSLGTCDPPRIN